MTIHREGHKILLLLSVFLIALNVTIRQFLLLGSTAELLVLIASVVVFLLVLQFFRSPKLSVHVDQHAVYAPADGKVVVIEDTREDEYFDSERKQISIFMSPLNVHVNRNPVSGVVQFFKYHAGKYLVAWHPKSSTENERTTVVVRTSSGIDILMRQIAGAVARRIKCYVDHGDQVAQGEEFGFIKFGSRVDVFLPLDAEIKVNVGEKTKAGRTILAVLKA